MCAMYLFGDVQAVVQWVEMSICTVQPDAKTRSLLRFSECARTGQIVQQQTLEPKCLTLSATTPLNIILCT